MTEVNLVVSKNLPSRIPRLQRSSTFHNLQLKKSPLRKENDRTSEDQDELGSLSSVYSGLSCVGADWSYRKKSPKYAFHCSTRHSVDNSSNEYLTPTQRANRKIRELQFLLKESEASCRMKSYTVERLSQELADCKLSQKNCTCNRQKENNDSRKEAETNDDYQSENKLVLTDSGLGWTDDYLSHLKDSEVVLPLHQASGSMEKRKSVSIHLQEIEKLKETHSSEVSYYLL